MGEPVVGGVEVRQLVRQGEAPEAFKEYIEERGRETGSWRGEV
ncbi:hypothetical protein ACFWBC_01510 [Streptomyces sp. NPDC059985]